MDARPYISYDDIEHVNTSYQVKASPLKKARQALRDIQDGTFHYATGVNAGSKGAVASITDSLEKGPDIVHEWLQRASLDASALDPTGRKSTPEMEAEIRDASRLGHIARPRRYFAALVAHGDHIDGVGQSLGGLPEEPREIAKFMTAELDAANEIAAANGQKPVDVSALDATGTKSTAQMQEEVNRRVVEGYVINARKELYLLKHFPNDIADGEDNKVEEWLDKANKAAKEFGFGQLDASVLDPGGKASAAEINRDLLKATESKHLEKASLILYWSQHGGFSDPNTASEYLRRELAAVNETAAALGEHPVTLSMINSDGGKYREQATRDLAELARGNLSGSTAGLEREYAVAQSAALRNEPALAARIRPLDTPASPMLQKDRQKSPS